MEKIAPRKFGIAAAIAAWIGAVLIVAPGAAAYADATREDQWMIDFLDLDSAWETSKGKGVIVGIVDSGVDADHRDLKNNVKGGKSFNGATKDGLKDADGHGTFTASLIAGHGHGDGNADGVIGAAPEAKILSAEVDIDNPEDFSYGDMADAIRWLADNGADVIAIGSAHLSDDKTEHEAIKYAAIERGIPIVGGAGNVGEDFDGTDLETPRTETIYPAGYEEVIGVSGISSNGKLSDVSMYGETVAVGAPGEDLIASVPGGGSDSFDGTSGALAITAGILALLKSKYPDESRMELIWRLTELATEAGEEGPDDKYGFGIVNPVKALTEDPGPLPEDLKDPEPTGTYPNDKASTKNDEAAADNSDGGTTTTVLIVAITTVIAIAAAVTLIILIRRMKRRNNPSLLLE